MDRVDNITKVETAAGEKDINDQLFEANIKLNEVTEHFIKNYNQVEEYSNLLEERNYELESMNRVHEIILDCIQEAVEIIDEEYTFIYQNQSSNKELDNIIGKKCHQVYYHCESPCSDCIAHQSLVSNRMSSRQGEIHNTKYEFIAYPLKSAKKTVLMRKHVAGLQIEMNRPLAEKKELGNVSAATIFREIAKLTQSLKKYARLLQEQGTMDISSKILEYCDHLKELIPNGDVRHPPKTNNSMREKPHSLPRATNTTRTILHIDDDKKILEIMRVVLKRNSYQIISETKGARTMELVFKHQPDLIILDIMMPDINGYDILKQLKENPATKDIPIVVLSVSNTKDKSLELGADIHITKPMDDKMLIAEINQLILP